ncbi:branched-chain amino acid ABC transporter permease [Nocardioides sp. TF02-7]|uniref:branched-chain amino acid ABC transporter permease n=1 Tax=Nocardioides sp. TF02-7 TaxID=2917724 RepID=UPI001F05F183|nr:branched-chain amino acid ABC transporter permease [Nocardioides sp. TF02-7]UMG91211.1 branched-chain amino acid ABC transporter permease [Nocardioides sp. TF02-7]
MSWYDTNLVLIQATITGLLLALSIQIPLRMGVFSFAGVGAYGFGCYAGAVLVLDHQMAALPTILVTTLAGGLIVLVLGLFINRLNGLTLAMATVAFDLIIGVVAVNGGETTGGATGRYGVISDFTMGHMWTILVVVMVLVALSERGKLGRRIDAVRDDPELASSVGIRVYNYRLAAFFVSGLLGAAAGAMNILVRSAITPLDIGFHLIVLALTMIIVGGSLSWKGAVIGAVVFTWLPDVLQVIGEWQELVYGVIVAVAAVLMPRGIYGLYVEAKRAVLRRRRTRRGAVRAAVAAERARTTDDDEALAEMEDDLGSPSVTPGGSMGANL